LTVGSSPSSSFVDGRLSGIVVSFFTPPDLADDEYLFFLAFDKLV